jgi:hypothetical protein
LMLVPPDRVKLLSASELAAYGINALDAGQILEFYTHWFGRLGTPSALLLSLYTIEGVPE